MRQSYTELRKSIVRCIEESPVPLTVGQIARTMSGKYDLSNVYRGMKYLEKEHLVESFSLNCVEEGNVRFYYRTGDEHSHFIHCETCHGFTRIGGCVLSDYQKKIERRYHCAIRSHILLFTGTCEECRAKSG
jgi:Fur family ferric uptake transcriptional regulator